MILPCHLCGNEGPMDPCGACVPSFLALCDAVPDEECEKHEECDGCPAYDGSAEKESDR
jgi:hypothetical protein